MLKDIKKRGLLDKNYPRESPVVEISEEQQAELNNGKVIMVTDTHYKAKYLVYKRSLVLELSQENLEVQCLESLDANPVRLEELRSFYKNYPQYSPI